MKQIPFFKMLDLSELATTARDLTPLLKSFREYDTDALRVLEEQWREVAADLDRAAPAADVVVLVSDGAYLLLPRANAVSLTLSIDARISSALATERSRKPTFDVVVEVNGRVSLMQVEHVTEVAALPQIDWSRSFSLWNHRRERDAHYVFLETGEAVLTWFNLASLAGCTEEELEARAGTTARSLTIAARHGDARVLCVRIDWVESFLREVESR